MFVAVAASEYCIPYRYHVRSLAGLMLGVLEAYRCGTSSMFMGVVDSFLGGRVEMGRNYMYDIAEGVWTDSVCGGGGRPWVGDSVKGQLLYRYRDRL